MSAWQLVWYYSHWAVKLDRLESTMEKTKRLSAQKIEACIGMTLGTGVNS